MVGLLLLTAANLFQVIRRRLERDPHLQQELASAREVPQRADHGDGRCSRGREPLLRLAQERGRFHQRACRSHSRRSVLGDPGLANFYPGVAWTDPEFLKAGQTLNDIAPQMILDPIILGVVFLGWYLARKPAR